MGVLSSEAVVLRTWPVHEADLIVSFFTRDYGKVRGVAKSALRSRKRFGGALEPMTVARAWFAERPRQELVRLDQLEIVRSPLSAPVDHARMTVLSFFAEVLDEAPARPRSPGYGLPVAAGGVGADHASPVGNRPAVDGADLFLPVDHAAIRPAAGYRPLHHLRRTSHRRRDQLQYAGRRAFLCDAPRRQRQRTLGRLLATGAADAPGAGSGLCRRGLDAPPRAGFAPLHRAGPGAPSGAQTALGGGPGTPGRVIFYSFTVFAESPRTHFPTMQTKTRDQRRMGISNLVRKPESSRRVQP